MSFDDTVDSDSPTFENVPVASPVYRPFVMARANREQLLLSLSIAEVRKDAADIRKVRAELADLLGGENEAQQAIEEYKAAYQRRREEEAQRAVQHKPTPVPLVSPPVITACKLPAALPPAAIEVTTDRVDTDEEPDEYVPDSEFPDYATNWDGTVICLGGPRKRKKRMRPCPDWAKTKDGKWYPVSYFQLTRGKGPERRTQSQMLMNRRDTLKKRNI
jgi:hypothetical protein